MRRRSSAREQGGHVLLGALMLVLLLSLLSLAWLYLVAQEAPMVSAMREQSQSHYLAEAAADLIVSWFHDPSAVPPPLAGLLMKRQETEDGPSFFDAAGRSQFIGTWDRPDMLLDASIDSDARLLNDSTSAFSVASSTLGRVDRLKIYGPTQPGLLGTVEVSASTRGSRPLATTIRLQVGALRIPAVRAAIQSRQTSLRASGGGTATVLAHWGDIRIVGDMAVNGLNGLILKAAGAPVTGHSYGTLKTLEDRWVDYWIGGTLSLLSSPSTGGTDIPANVYLHQEPTPGVRLDYWQYELLKKTAQRYGTYYRLDREGRLHPSGSTESDPGLSPSEALASPAVGYSRGLVFVDTVDGEVPRSDNLGTLVIDTDYVEALLVVQGHVVLKPSGAGRSVTVLSPPPEGSSALSGRIPVTLSGIHLNGLLHAAGVVTLEQETRIYGGVIVADTLTAGRSATLLEVWYNADFGKGFFRGLPVVYRAPATWQVTW